MCKSCCIIVSSSGQNACLATGLRSDPLRELKRSPDFNFGPQMHPKRLAAWLCPDPLGDLQHSPRPPSFSGSGQNACLEAGLHSDPLRELKRSPDFIFGLKCTQKKRLAAGLRPDPLGALRRTPSPPSCSGRGRFAAKQGKIVTSGYFPRHCFTHKSHPSINQAPQKIGKSKILFKYIFLNRLCE